jgi:hypothetical protein
MTNEMTTVDRRKAQTTRYQRTGTDRTTPVKRWTTDPSSAKISLNGSFRRHHAARRPQSLWALNMKTDAMLGAAEQLDQAGFESLEFFSST